MQQRLKYWYLMDNAALKLFLRVLCLTICRRIFFHKVNQDAQTYWSRREKRRNFKLKTLISII